MNYTGLSKVDGDFDGNISAGDLNKNNLIDAFDISTEATQHDGGALEESNEKLSGTLEIGNRKQTHQKGETIEILIRGKYLKLVNALSFALPYNAEVYEFIGVQLLNKKQLDNFT
jgi:hypothetical protein